MKFISTRGQKNLNFSDIALRGYAEDGGLILPEFVPQIDEQMWNKFATLSYQELLIEFVSLFVDEIEVPKQVWKSITETAFKNFTSKNVIEIIKLKEKINYQNNTQQKEEEEGNFYIEELFHGPTFAFKDLGLQIIGSLFDYLLEKQKKTINVIVSTSGDTGSAAIEAIRYQKRSTISVLYPQNRTSHNQELQMIKVTSPNVKIFQVEGTSDDADVPMNKLFSDVDFSKKFHLCTINSINFVRILVQMVHFLIAHLKICKKFSEKILISVPTGAFGNCFSGIFLKKMGINIEFVVATNRNDILCRFFKNGEFKVGDEVFKTTSPSMDIQVPYNFERLLYYAVDQNTDKVLNYMKNFEKSKEIILEEKEFLKSKENINSFYFEDEQISEIIKKVWNQYNYLLDPHTAVGFLGAKKFSKKNLKTIVISTAHPSKFVETIEKIFGNYPASIPDIFQELEKLPRNDIFLSKKDDWEKIIRKEIEKFDLNN